MEVEHYLSLWPAEFAEECNIVEPPKAVTSPQTAAMKRHEAMPPRYCYEQPVARHRLHAMVTSASLRVPCGWRRAIECVGAQVRRRRRLYLEAAQTAPAFALRGVRDGANGCGCRRRQRIRGSRHRHHHHHNCITIVSVTGGGGGDRSSLCSTPLSCDGVECVFAFPVGARAIGRVGARRFDAAGACVVQAPGDGCT